MITSYEIRPIGYVESSLVERAHSCSEGARSLIRVEVAP
jgi:hypothetical protein